MGSVIFTFRGAVLLSFDWHLTLPSFKLFKMVLSSEWFTVDWFDILNEEADVVDDVDADDAVDDNTDVPESRSTDDGNEL